MFSEKDIETLTSTSIYTNSFVIVKDNCFSDIIEEIYNDIQIVKNYVRPARMNRGDDEFLDESLRGDSICWITPTLCKELNLNGLDEYVKRIIMENQIFKEYLSLDDDYNIQFAIYPGKGEGYNRHRDAFPNNNNETITTSRQLTMLLYLNKDWETEDGGQLRVFTHPGVLIDGLGEGFCFWGVNGYDINPIFGRMVIFRSELVGKFI
jgi:Rps23 Pro-64 3,4-dihydroxylase Tpa1-like proline 4-hydroxylase